MRKLYAMLLLLFSIGTIAHAQQLLGTATLIGGNEYQLTTEGNYSGQSGGVWKNGTFMLSTPFTINAQLNFGRFGEAPTGVLDPTAAGDFKTGADGIAFVLSGLSYIGGPGEGIGYRRFGAPTFTAEFDTWRNLNPATEGVNNHDPAGGEDHMAFTRGGNPDHGAAQNLSFTPRLLPNIEDNQWHNVMISWNPGTGLSVSFDGGAPMFALAADVVNEFGGNPNALVTWGFTGGTFSGVNDQRVRVNFAGQCPTSVSVSSSALPALDACHNANTIFLGYGPQCVTFTATATPTVSGNTYTWYRTGSSTPLGTGNPFTFCPTAAGTYNVYVVVSNGSCTPVSSANSAISISVIDIRCGKNNQNKVNVCHKENGVHGNGTIGDNSHTNCVGVDAVPAHLAHGDCLGECPNGNRTMPVEVKEETKMSPNGLSVYPNPSYGNVQVNLGGASGEIQIINDRGIVVEKRTTKGSQSVSLDLKKYGKGMFLVKFISGESVQTSKVLVQ